MKTCVSLGLALLTLASAQAQIFRPEAVNGALLGGIAGAVIGHNSGSLSHNGWQGAAIGAGAGLLIGSAIGNANDAARNTQVATPTSHGPYVYRERPAVYAGVATYGYGRGGYGYGRDYRGDRRFAGTYFGGYSGGYVSGYDYAPAYGYAPAYTYGDAGSYDYGSGNSATNGLLLGGLAGGIIGHNSGSLGHNGWRGAAWGAGLGWLLGSVADANRRAVVYERPAQVVSASTSAVAMQPQPAAAPAQPVTAVNNYHGTSAAPMSGANSLFGRGN